ncbi:VOC family protein, partial [Streptomyces sp. NPDC054829]
GGRPAAPPHLPQPPRHPRPPRPPDGRAPPPPRLLALGARRADVGQGEQSWTVLMDPEGNEFCVLSSRRR